MKGLQLHYYNAIMAAYANGDKSYMGFDLSTQESGTETQKETYKSEHAKWIASKIAILATRNTLSALIDALPEPYKTQAIDNGAFTYRSGKSAKEVEYHNAFNALSCRFTWADTPQDHDYWEDFAMTLPDAGF